MLNRLPDILYRGSVKDVRGNPGDSHYYFEYSDRYSVFDWGEMPDLLPQKGESLAVIADMLFDHLGNKLSWQNWRPLRPSVQEFIRGLPLLQQLRSQGLSHHGLGLVNGLMKVVAVEVMSPEKDFNPYLQRPTGALVPLEVIFRWGIQKGSSLLKRLGDKDYQLSLDLPALNSTPKVPVGEGTRFLLPVIEFSTKLESIDRPLTYQQAQELAGMNGPEFVNLLQTARVLACYLEDLFTQLGIELLDGKFEFAFMGVESEVRQLMLVDAIGPDELRLVKNGVQLSKEIFRRFYRETAWYRDLEAAKFCREQINSMPENLDPHLRQWGSALYPALGNLISEKLYGKKVWDQAKELSQVLLELEKWCK